MVHYDGHEVALVTTFLGGAALLHKTMPRGWIRGMIHRQPVVALSMAWGLIGMGLPLVVPPVRRMLKMPTNQYDAIHPKATFPVYKD